MQRKILSLLSRNLMVFGNRTKHRCEGMIQCLSLSMIVIASGLCVSLLFFPGEKVKWATGYKNSEKPYHAQNLERLCRTEVSDKVWEYIVIHHSATARGNAAQFDHYHREKRKWEHGLAYHFVIGNGSFSGDGEIEVGNRWKRQIHGAHTANANCNRVAIGICLVGDFENTDTPTENQIEALVRLIQHLSRKYKIDSSNILQHKQVHQKCTACPGKNFPFAEVKTRLLQIVSKRNTLTQEL